MIKKLGYILVILTLVILGGAGWFFSGVIYEGALNPEFNDSGSIGTAEDRVLVSEVNSNSIILNVEEELWGPLLERGIYGIIGQNGDAVVGNIISTEGTTVKRELLKAINNNKIEDAFNWSGELICAGHYLELWENIILISCKNSLPIFLNVINSSVNGILLNLTILIKFLPLQTLHLFKCFTFVI